MPHKVWLSNLWNAVHQEHKIKTYHTIQFNLRETFYITIEYFNTFFNSLHIFTLLVLYIQSILSCTLNLIMMTWSHRNIVLFVMVMVMHLYITYLYITYIYSKVLYMDASLLPTTSTLVIYIFTSEIWKD